MIAQLQAALEDERQQLAHDAMTKASLDMDAFVKYVHMRGQYAGLTKAIEVMQDMMNERNER